MYKEIENSRRMTADEACAMYPDDFILMRSDDLSFNITGIVLYVGDDYQELYRMAQSLEKPSFCIVLEGINHQRSLGGVVVGG